MKMTNVEQLQQLKLTKEELEKSIQDCNNSYPKESIAYLRQLLNFKVPVLKTTNEYLEGSKILNDIRIRNLVYLAMELYSNDLIDQERVEMSFSRNQMLIKVDDTCICSQNYSETSLPEITLYRDEFQATTQKKIEMINSREQFLYLSTFQSTLETKGKNKTAVDEESLEALRKGRDRLKKRDNLNIIVFKELKAAYELPLLETKEEQTLPGGKVKILKI